MGLPADDIVDRLRKHRMDRRRTGEVFEFEGASIRLLCELALAAVAFFRTEWTDDEQRDGLRDALNALRASGLLPEEAEHD